jgi:radical SAM protein with 4Fe4S-binding SPASM domain
MKRLPKDYRVQRILLQIKHGQLKDLARKNLAYISRRINKRGKRFPLMVLVEATNNCMLDCIMCPHSQLEEETGYMSFDLYKKIIDECSQHSSMAYLSLGGMGEPLMHPRLSEMSKYAKSKGIPKVGLSTNAVLLTKKRTEEILEDSGIDEIAFSLDAINKDTYQKIKRRSSFQAVQKNIAYFLSQKRKRWKPFVNLHILKMKETVSEIDDFLKKWIPQLGKGDYILVKDVHNFAGQVEDRRLKEQIYSAVRSPCRQLWKLLFVSWKGDVMPCCMDPHRKLKIGNLEESTLEELWKSPSLQKYRQIHLQGRYDEIPLCSKCEQWWYLGEAPTGE